MKRIKGLDSIRFICALYVLFMHLGIPFMGLVLTPNLHNGFKYLFGTMITLIFNGGAAVTIFFIISGFCIHYPFRNKQTIDLLPYYTRRLLRIGLPASVAICIYILLHEDLKPPSFGVFWSIICEVIFYIIYPIIFYIKKYLKLDNIVIISFLVALFYFFTHLKVVIDGNHDYPAFGFSTWIIGLPCWLMGCWLTENYHRFKVLSNKGIWLMRGSMVFLGLLLHIIKFHVLSIWGSNCLILNIFSIIACAWLGFEIMYLQEKKPFKLFEWCGKWSYSLYIIHPIIPSLLASIGLVNFSNKHNPVAIILSLLASYIFYLSIEKPSHKFSAYMASIFSRKKIIEDVIITPVLE